MKSLPGLLIHPLASYSASTTIGLFSATAYNLHPGEDLWINFNFKVTSDLNQKLIKELPVHPLMPDLNSPTELPALFSQFSQVTVNGDNVRMTSFQYGAANLSN